MTLKLRSPIVAAFGIAAVSCGDASGPLVIDTEWSGQVAQGDQIEIKGVNGDILAGPTSGNSVIVTVTKRGNTSDPNEVDIEVITHDGGVTICAMYPDIPGEPANECGPGTEGRMNTRDNDVEVRFQVAVPEGVGFTAYVVNGSVTATDLESDVTAYTVNGSVDISTSLHATAGSVNGSIDATIGIRDLDYDLTYATVNGDVRLRVPTDMNADVQLQTVNGSVTAEMAFTVVSPGDIRGVLGLGGRRLVMTTVNGSLELDTGG
jgi:DUF4097 and DUF4098 domain-containing protein YvlB